jgi:hypothetical protein
MTVGKGGMGLCRYVSKILFDQSTPYSVIYVLIIITYGKVPGLYINIKYLLRSTSELNHAVPLLNKSVDHM